MLSFVGSGRKSLSHASHKDKVFDNLAKHAEKSEPTLLLRKASFVTFFVLLLLHRLKTREQNAVVLVEHDLRINVTYDCLLFVTMQDRVSRD
mmetsp:Transcript_23491/g.42634  ORF Transcript_23491/g.42634 Transcript_23491/m.42634 type:complete len:92 (+) Transcript_23491:807-1082(+)